MKDKEKLKAGDKIVCITDAYKDFTKGKEYEIFNIDLKNIIVKNDYGVSINFLSLHNTFKIKEETATSSPFKPNGDPCSFEERHDHFQSQQSPERIES